MRFRRGAKLDPSQVTDLRGRGGGRGLAVGGGGLGLIVLVVALLLGVDPTGGSGGTDPFSRLDDQAVGQPDGQGPAQDCRTAEQANEREDCRIVGVVNSLQTSGTRPSSAPGRQYRPADTVLFTDASGDRLRLRELAGRPVLLPARPARVHRSRLLRRAPRGSARPATVRAGVRDRARVRAPRAEPAGRSDEVAAGRDGPRERGRALGAAGRLLRGRLGGQRGADRAAREADAATSTRAWTRPPPWATTASRQATQGRVNPERGRTARPSSAAAGSAAATRAAGPPPATPSRRDLVLAVRAQRDPPATA